MTNSALSSGTTATVRVLSLPELISPILDGLDSIAADLCACALLNRTWTLLAQKLWANNEPYESIPKPTNHEASEASAVYLTSRNDEFHPRLYHLPTRLGATQGCPHSSVTLLRTPAYARRTGLHHKSPGRNASAREPRISSVPGSTLLRVGTAGDYCQGISGTICSRLQAAFFPVIAAIGGGGTLCATQRFRGFLARRAILVGGFRSQTMFSCAISPAEVDAAPTLSPLPGSSSTPSATAPASTHYIQLSQELLVLPKQSLPFASAPGCRRSPESRADVGVLTSGSLSRLSQFWTRFANFVLMSSNLDRFGRDRPQEGSEIQIGYSINSTCPSTAPFGSRSLSEAFSVACLALGTRVLVSTRTGCTLGTLGTLGQWGRGTRQVIT
ncbi:hypothetical protein FB45DRAFT_877409 [Roridomyces roridus]|uniref:F-box domain-containing protein n=1 Tax=Roridomyces roridus TaxID=1738132 RepID=A0AAD7B2L8_9AGAR|nr:hypothetical protein FB45DRAFT_877409 [Roridomyces roridus]